MAQVLGYRLKDIPGAVPSLADILHILVQLSQLFLGELVQVVELRGVVHDALAESSVQLGDDLVGHGLGHGTRLVPIHDEEDGGLPEVAQLLEDLQGVVLGEDDHGLEKLGAGFVEVVHDLLARVGAVVAKNPHEVLGLIVLLISYLALHTGNQLEEILTQEIVQVRILLGVLDHINDGEEGFSGRLGQ